MTRQEKEKYFLKKAKSLIENHGKCLNVDCKNCLYRDVKMDCFTFEVIEFCEKFLLNHEKNRQLEFKF